MKFALVLLSDEGKQIKSNTFNTWYDDISLKQEISMGGIDTLEHIAEVISRSLKEEIDISVKKLLFIG
jgi:hypothetical protein